MDSGLELVDTLGYMGHIAALGFACRYRVLGLGDLGVSDSGLGFSGLKDPDRNRKPSFPNSRTHFHPPAQLRGIGIV